MLEQLLSMYPQADLFAVCDFVPEGDRHFLQGRTPTTSFIQKLPGARKRYRNYLPLMPLAMEQLDVSGYDIVISSSHAVAKGVLTGPDQLHVSYVHTPIRYAWDLQHQYLRESGLNHGLKGWLARVLLHRIRVWDSRTASGVDAFVANSQFIGRRIWKVYRRESDVVYPPVDVEVFTIGESKEDFYLTASRLVPYKRVDLIVEAFAKMPERRLVVIGDGPERAKVERLAAGHPNIELLGYQSSEVLVDHMRRAKAFVFAAEEDFGITPVEAQACGTPVIAYGRGGSLETVRGLAVDKPTGVFFDSQSVAAMIHAVEQFGQSVSAFKAVHCRENALRFSAKRFQTQFAELVVREWTAFERRRNPG
ncbi:glycosyltransferase family 4 protein [Rhodanobacter sp. MP7CTX1]|uniref:glycosyltransferase n=1 Tax=Rhodanobacter sp. MP7CTX1 TaxID=2723084 RepID=UPI00179FA3AA|nr:glycosyltransferase involved in cell wall biosynthesis [Rhodanobacter sp. MP7CTX1]